MNRIQKKTYQRDIMLAMAAYMIVVLVIWPMARTTPSLPLKIAFALAPLVPLTWAIWLMAKRIWFSDELEQRTHLVGLGVATIVVSVFSLVGGFLANAKLMSQDASAELLLWVFPLLLVSYGLAQLRVRRHYGLDGACSNDESFPTYLRLLGVAVLLAILTVWGYYRPIDSARLGLLAGMTTGVGVVTLIMGVRRWRRRHEQHE
ncbi:MAG: hypothetical protein ACREPN_07085 [Rudaea sp.]